MRVLLHTHILLWILAEPGRLDEETRETIETGAEEVLFSAASIWEIAISIARPGGCGRDATSSAAKASGREMPAAIAFAPQPADDPPVGPSGKCLPVLFR
jgi:hypothetical protein